MPLERVLIRIPATWEGIQAAKALEAQGVATHLILVYRRGRAHAPPGAAALGPVFAVVAVMRCGLVCPCVSCTSKGG